MNFSWPYDMYIIFKFVTNYMSVCLHVYGKSQSLCSCVGPPKNGVISGTSLWSFGCDHTKCV